ncbi:cell wall metabolism sensor histidine kinase WalK [Streptomyces sp. NBC_00233]|uniref:sensor histidine kinase n=1 Tax=Streptomyces sp. NBC_00233 TaxID=2975686 RepID=UPI0022591432|nr:ATP-binding protein [Streptomyces sp. NBC_00233]MCX5233103.1 HAMP domain-containing histidine kinase [Streptomyces sp. NBC_00233]
MRAHLTIRWRLAVLLTAVCLCGGAALLTLVYYLVARQITSWIPVQLVMRPSVPPSGQRMTAVYSASEMEQLFATVSHTFMLRLLGATLITLLVLALASACVGWLVSGRMLRPVTRIAARLSRLSRDSMHERIGLSGPDDEIKRLADAFDNMAGRLQQAFDSQQRFIANVSHEIRAPLTVQRAMLELRLRPGSPEALDAVRGQLLETNRHIGRLIDGLMTLAESDRGIESAEQVQLAHLVRESVVRHTGAAEAAGVEITGTMQGEGVVCGDQVLLTHLIDNLLSNAVAYNTTGGRVAIALADRHLSVSNTGVMVSEADVERLFEPFHRHQPDRTAMPPGSGLGLSIVRSIAEAHGAVVTATARAAGGLTVKVAFRAGPERPGAGYGIV